MHISCFFYIDSIYDHYCHYRRCLSSVGGACIDFHLIRRDLPPADAAAAKIGGGEEAAGGVGSFECNVSRINGLRHFFHYVSITALFILMTESVCTLKHCIHPLYSSCTQFCFIILRSCVLFSFKSNEAEQLLLLAIALLGLSYLHKNILHRLCSSWRTGLHSSNTHYTLR